MQEISQFEHYKLQQLVSFYLNENLYAVNVKKVQEVIPMTEITPIPKAPEFIEGVINKRKKILPVIDLRRHFQLKVESHRECRILIMDVKGRDVGFIVDRVATVVRLEAREIEPPPTIKMLGIKTDCISGLVQNSNETIMLVLDLDKAFSLEEKVTLQRLKL